LVNSPTAQSLERCTQPYLTISFTFKRQDIQGEVSNNPPHIAAHLQGTQSRHTEANLAKELQLPTHGGQSLNSDRQHHIVLQTLFHFDNNFSFCTTCFNVSHCFVGLFKRKHFINNRFYDSRFYQFCNLT